MKSMMKKTLSVIIALAMILVPMSVFAAVGDPIPVPSWQYCIYSGDTVTVGAGETIYFEIATEGSEETFGFVVEGAGDFDVTVCTEDGAGAYLDGTPVSAVDGKVETTIAGFASTYYYCAFAITNNSSESVDYVCTIDFPVGTQSNPCSITLSVGGTAEVTVPAYSEYYVAATLPQPYVEYQLTITGNTGFGIQQGYMPTWDIDGIYVGTVASYWGPASICMLNNTDAEQTYTFALADIPKPLGSQYNPDELPMDTTTTKTIEGAEYWYSWTAAEDGTFTFAYENDLCANGWTYYIENANEILYYSTGWDEYDYVSCSFDVAAGDVVIVGVSVPTYIPDYDAFDVYTCGYGDVVFTTSFVAGEIGGDDIGGDDIGGDDIGGGEEEEELNYADYTSTYLELGENMYVVDGSYQYTVYSFEPTEEGKYTFTSEDSVMGIVSYNGMWVLPNEPSAGTVNANEFSWECTSVGQAIWVAVMADTNVATIEITKEDLEAEDEVQWVVYENVTTPENFTFDGDAADLLYVDTLEDDVVDTAVLGDDGYYHLNSADGPILYVDIMGSLDDTLLSASAAYSYGQLTAVFQDENLVVISKTDYNEAFAEYAACADAETGLYPLTADLMEIYKNVGAAKGWYGDTGVVGGTEDDAWMFACYYLETVEEGGNEGGDNTGDDNTGNNVADPEIPDTGAEVAGIAIAMMATVAALGATVVTTKKSKRVK